jgi:alkylated DNA repair dioxygenase AlkB
MLEPLFLPGADLLFDPRWLPAPAADKLFKNLRDPVQAGIDWEVHRLKIFGREVESPRLSRWIGDPGASYRYSGVRFEPASWPRALGVVRKAVNAAAGEEFNSVLANLYRDGNDTMGWHSDDEPELGAQPIIASLSLGAMRKFVLKSRAPGLGRAWRFPAANRIAQLRKRLHRPRPSGSARRNLRQAGEDLGRRRGGRACLQRNRGGGDRRRKQRRRCLWRRARPRQRRHRRLDPGFRQRAALRFTCRRCGGR